MNWHQLVYCGGFTTVGLIGGCLDLRKSHTIPNWLTYSGIICGLTAHLMLDGWLGLASSFLGCLLGFLCVLPFYLKRGMAGGDLKLVLATSSFAALPYFYPVLVWSALSAATIAFLIALATGYLKTAILNTFSILAHSAKSPLSPHPELNVDNPSVLKVPFGAGVAIGCAIAFAVALSQSGVTLHSYSMRSGTHTSSSLSAKSNIGAATHE
jgi:prepilin peptidase CpaA